MAQTASETQMNYGYTQTASETQMNYSYTQTASETRMDSGYAFWRLPTYLSHANVDR